MLSIDLSNYCSKQCSFCYNHSHHEGNVDWQTGEIIAFAKDCIVHGVRAISLGGGEPFEYPGIFEVIKALQPLAYLSITTNGLPLEHAEVWQQLEACRPDKIHVTIHFPDNATEVARVISLIKRLQSKTDIKPGVNLLVSANTIEYCKNVFSQLRNILSPEQIILVPQRFANTPTPAQLSSVSGGEPFQSPSCLLQCTRPQNFASVSWDKRVNSCSFAGGKEKLTSLDYNGLSAALDRVKFGSCLPSKN
ncbi:MAG: radical SAM protein [Bacteroidales bacterium]|nr:radical SAM protein [Bacteroidales bacterium]